MEVVGGVRDLALFLIIFLFNHLFNIDLTNAVRDYITKVNEN